MKAFGFGWLLAAALLGGCGAASRNAGASGDSGSAGGSGSGSGITVFGTIDAAVSGSSNKSGR